MPALNRAATFAVLLALTACGSEPTSYGTTPMTDTAAALHDGSGAPSQLLYGVTALNFLIKFDAAQPCRLEGLRRITGLKRHEDVLGIDFRPATGELYALGSTSRLYLIDPATAAATLVGTGPFTPALDGKAFGFDFNPTVDRIRVVSNTGQNLRLNPITGAVAAVDTALAYAAADVNAGNRPGVVGAAYTNPDNDPATGTTLYDLDARYDRLVTQAPPNGGVLNTVGDLYQQVGRAAGFDIAASGAAYGVWQSDDHRWRRGCGPSALYTIDLATGKANRVGSIASITPVRALAAVLK